jgi:glycogen(starch) synthase
MLFEVAWEVCWQLGGIYTVLRSKAATTLRTWGDRYCLIGPYNPQTAPVEFEPEQPTGAIAEALQRLREGGVPCHFGRWMIAGRPQVILLDYRAGFRELDSNKYMMWADHGISINSNDGEMNEVVAFGFAVTEFFRHLSGLMTDRSILAHFHEWMGGVAVPRIAHLRLPIATIFTTHATLLGRYIAGDNPEFYNHLPFLNPDFEAQKYQIYSRYQVEKAAAHASTVFTTVSEVTSYEAEKLLGRRPEVILPNGLNIQRFAALHEFQNLHRQYKEKINEFVMGHFFPCYNFDLDRTIYLVTSGRYEYRNKGMDLFLEAMWRLNQRLRYVPDHPTVVVFVITKAPVKHVNIGALQNQTMFDELHRTCLSLQEEMGEHLFRAAAEGRIADSKELFTGDAIVRLKRAMHAWRTGQPPAIVTHDLVDDANDPVLKHLRHRHLFNSADDPVKMVFHPQFVTPTGPLIHLDYEQMVRGCHMGVFPSYYEPWGYTPMECVALGVPAVTTDLSGFGAYVRRHIPDSNDKGICVLNRRYRGFDEACNELVDYLFDFVRMNRRQRIELRNRVERLSELFDWSALIRHYNEAHDLALERVGATRPGRLEIRLV